LSFKLFQNLVIQVKDVTGYDFGIMDKSGSIIACSNDKKIGSIFPDISSFSKTKEQIVKIGGSSYFKLYNKSKLEYVTFIESVNETEVKCLELASINLMNIKQFYDEKFDRNSFIRSILSGSILLEDITLKAKGIHLTINVRRVVFLIKVDKEKDLFVNDVIQSMFPNSAKDFVIVLEDSCLALVKEIRLVKDKEEIEKTAKSIVDTLGTELMVKAYVGIGSEVDNIRDIERSYKEAAIALTIGNIFDGEKEIFDYNNLGISRLIYQLPVDVCKMYLKEVLKEINFDVIDAETIHTVQKFFENNLNISETSRQLYVHRNTLVYRLDKIQKLTGLNLNRFDDAIILKIAMLVKKFIDKSEGVL